MKVALVTVGDEILDGETSAEFNATDGETESDDQR